MKSTTLFLPNIPWFKDLLREVNKNESIASYLFNLAADDLYARKAIKKNIYEAAKNEIKNHSKKPRPAILSGQHNSCKLYIKEPFQPLIEAIEKLEFNRTSYLWTLMVNNTKITAAQMNEFNEAYPRYKKTS